MESNSKRKSKRITTGCHREEDRSSEEMRQETVVLLPEFYTISFINQGQLSYKFILRFLKFPVGSLPNCFYALASLQILILMGSGQVLAPKSLGSTPCLFIHLAVNTISNLASMIFHRSRAFNSILGLYIAFHLRTAVHVTTLSHHVPMEQVGGSCY